MQRNCTTVLHIPIVYFVFIVFNLCYYKYKEGLFVTFSVFLVPLSPTSSSCMAIANLCHYEKCILGYIWTLHVFTMAHGGNAAFQYTCVFTVITRHELKGISCACVEHL